MLTNGSKLSNILFECFTCCCYSIMICTILFVSSMSDKGWHCVLCGTSFSSRSKLTVHQKLKHQVTPPRLPRENAAYGQAMPSEREGYLLRDLTNRKVSLVKTSTPKSFLSVKKFKCYLCGDKFDDFQKLNSHLKVKHNVLKKLTKPVYACGLCAAKFYSKSFLVKHSKTHRNKNI